jgi:hypothetical protein
VISGTSMDGIDVALIATDGREAVTPAAGATYPYPAALRDELLTVIADPQRAEHAPLRDIEAAVTRAAHGDAIARFLEERSPPSGPDVIGLHGQTIAHRPERRFTRQLGSGPEIAARFGIKTVYRFRHADVAAGGEGAPLVPLYHKARNASPISPSARSVGCRSACRPRPARRACSPAARSAIRLPLMRMQVSDRHCERSEAIQGPHRGLWIASSAAPPRNDESTRKRSPDQAKRDPGCAPSGSVIMRPPA